MMFGMFSLSTLALMALYCLGFFQMFNGARKAGYTYGKAFWYAVSWPVTLWSIMNDLWEAPPPSQGQA